MTAPTLATDCPIERFKAIFERAAQSEPDVPDAVTLATATLQGKPSARVVLMKQVDQRGFVFFTNYGSRKARELDANPQAALCFHFRPLGEQVRVEGRVERVAAEDADAYFASRPLGSRIAAIASRQSQPIASREELMARVRELEQAHADVSLQRPDFWGGFRLVPELIEFWVHRDNRLHDRWVYSRDPEGDWQVIRLAP